MNTLPKHVALIMDGNRRWAQKRGLPVLTGYRRGTKVLKSITKKSSELSISELSIFAFSTENWKRLPSEVNTLFRLVEIYLKSETAEINSNNIKIKFVGNKNNFHSKLRNLIEYSEKLTENNRGLKLNIALDYGGKKDIIESINNIISNYQNKNKTIGIYLKMNFKITFNHLMYQK